MSTIIPERLAELQEATIHIGHGGSISEACTADWAGYLAGEDTLTLTDTPPCTDKRLARLVHGVNDGIEDEEVRTEKGRKLAPLLVGTAGREEEIKALLDRLAVKRLRTIVLPLADTWPDSVREEVVSAIEGVCDALGGDGDLSAAQSAAESAAESAESAWSARSARSARAARSAARSAAWSAAWSAQSAAQSAAWSAAQSARSAAWSARSAAWSAAESARSAEADLLIAELEAFHDA